MVESETLFKPIKVRRAFEEISAEIKRQIFKGILKPGDKLPSEVELARQFNVARQTVREALRILELSGFIIIQKGPDGGPIISDTISSSISNSLLDAILLRSISLDELTTARLEIEKVVLNYAIENAVDEDIERLRDNVLRARKRVASNIVASTENIEFHRLLAKASKNLVFVIVVESIMTVVADFLSRLQPDLEKSWQVVEAHEEILEALIRRRKEESIALLEKHLLEVKSRLQEIYDKLIQEQD